MAGRGPASGRCLLIDAATGRIEQTLIGAESPINALAFSPTTAGLLAAAEGLPSVVGHVRLWTLGAKEPRVFTGHTDSIYALAFNPAGDRLVTASYDKLLMLWDVPSGNELHTLKHHTAAVFAVAFSPDGKTLVSAAADQTVKLWNVETGQRVLTLTEPTKGLNAVAFHPRGHEIAAAGIDKMIRIYEWNGTTAKLKRSAFGHDAPILSLAYSPDGGTLFTGSEDRRIKAWDSATLQERHVYANLPDWPQTLAVSRDGSRLAAGLCNGDLMLFDAASAKKVRDVLKAGQPQVAVHGAFLPPFVGGGRGGTVGRDDGLKIENCKLKNANLSGAEQIALEDVIATRRTPPNPPLRRGGGIWDVLAMAMIGQQAGPAKGADDAAKPKPNPPMPRLDAVSPRTVVRGNKVKFTLSGQNIRDADRLFVSLGNLTATLLAGDEKNANLAFCEIEIPADMPPAVVALRLHTPLGSTTAKTFYVGPFAETGEKEDNNKPELATPAALPATLVGTINAKGDRDIWSFEAKAGEELVFVLVGPSLGSMLNARLTLTEAGGKTLASAVRQPWKSDVALTHRFDAAGKYLLRVEDRDYTGGGNHFYYIHAGAFPYVTDAYPLGMKTADGGPAAGDQVQAIEVHGANLPAETKLHPTPGIGARFPAIDTPGGKTLNTARYESSPFPEYAESEPNDTPAQARHLPCPAGNARDESPCLRLTLSPPLRRRVPTAITFHSTPVAGIGSPLKSSRGASVRRSIRRSKSLTQPASPSRGTRFGPSPRRTTSCATTTRAARESACSTGKTFNRMNL